MAPLPLYRYLSTFQSILKAVCRTSYQRHDEPPRMVARADSSSSNGVRPAPDHSRVWLPAARTLHYPYSTPAHLIHTSNTQVHDQLMMVFYSRAKLELKELRYQPATDPQADHCRQVLTWWQRKGSRQQGQEQEQGQGQGQGQGAGSGQFEW